MNMSWTLFLFFFELVWCMLMGFHGPLSTSRLAMPWLTRLSIDCQSLSLAYFHISSDQETLSGRLVVPPFSLRIPFVCNNSSFIICHATFRSCIRFALSSFGNCASRSLRRSDHMTSHICCVWFIPVTNMHAPIDHVCLFAPSSQFSLVLPFLEC